MTLLPLSGCGFNDDFDSSFNRAVSDFESLFDDTSESPYQRKPNPNIQAQNKPLPLINKNYSSEKKPTIKKTLPQNNIHTTKKEEPKLNITECKQDLFLSNKNISNLYKTYLTKNKACKTITAPNVVYNFISILTQHYMTQDIRILNADNDFLKLYATAIHNAQASEKVLLNKQILNYNCHLLKPTSCALIKKSLY